MTITSTRGTGHTRSTASVRTRIGTGVGFALWGVLLLAGAAIVPERAEAQQGQAAGEPVDLVFDREVFHYPAFERRNPFRALTGDDDAGPRFENLVLLGILQSQEPLGSVALFGVSRGGGGQPTGQTYRLREGDRMGNSRVLEIRARQVVMEVEEFGLLETRTLLLERALPQPRPGPEDAAPDAPPAEPPAAPPPEVEADTLEVGFDWSRSEFEFIEDRRNGNGGWS